MTKVAKKKARRLGRTIRKTLGTLFLISALVVAAIPVDYLQAEGEDTTAEDGIMAMADRTDTKITLGLNKDTSAKYRSNIPDLEKGYKTIYSTGDGKFQFAYVKSTGAEILRLQIFWAMTRMVLWRAVYCRYQIR